MSRAYSATRLVTILQDVSIWKTVEGMILCHCSGDVKLMVASAKILNGSSSRSDSLEIQEAVKVLPLGFTRDIGSCVLIRPYYKPY